MVILHICGVENKMSNGATVAALNHINQQAKTGLAKIWVCHVKDERLPWDDAVTVIPFLELHDKVGQVDLAIFHEIYYMPFFKAAGWLRRDKIPYVVLPHGGLTAGAQNQRRLPKFAVNLLLAKPFISKAAAVHFLSDREYQTSAAWNPTHLIAPNGVEIPKECKKYEDTSKGLELIYIGRINIFYKGLDILCHACDTIKDFLRRESVHITIYGPREGEDYEQLIAMIRQGHMEDVIAVKDGIFGAEKIRVMQQADAFLQPSRSEGMPMGILDAMALGLPVIVTPGTSFDTLVRQKDCGWVCDCNSQALAETLQQVAKERHLLAERSKNARECMELEYQWGAVARRTLKQYETLIEK